MGHEKAINLKKAAAMAGMSSSLFIYYMNSDNPPPFREEAGFKLFYPTQIREWIKNHRRNKSA